MRISRSGCRSRQSSTPASDARGSLWKNSHAGTTEPAGCESSPQARQSAAGFALNEPTPEPTSGIRKEPPPRTRITTSIITSTNLEISTGDRRLVLCDSGETIRARSRAQRPMSLFIAPKMPGSRSAQTRVSSATNRSVGRQGMNAVPKHGSPSGRQKAKSLNNFAIDRPAFSTI